MGSQIETAGISKFTGWMLWRNRGIIAYMFIRGARLTKIINECGPAAKTTRMKDLDGNLISQEISLATLQRIRFGILSDLIDQGIPVEEALIGIQMKEQNQTPSQESTTKITR